eukprot:493074-Rhodomonas_salina.2
MKGCARREERERGESRKRAWKGPSQEGTRRGKKSRETRAWGGSTEELQEGGAELDASSIAFRQRDRLELAPARVELGAAWKGHRWWRQSKRRWLHR